MPYPLSSQSSRSRKALVTLRKMGARAGRWPGKSPGALEAAWPPISFTASSSGSLWVCHSHLGSRSPEKRHVPRSRWWHSVAKMGASDLGIPCPWRCHHSPSPGWQLLQDLQPLPSHTCLRRAPPWVTPARRDCFRPSRSPALRFATLAVLLLNI